MPFTERAFFATALPRTIVPERAPSIAITRQLAEVLRTNPPRRWLEQFKNPNALAGAEFEAQLWANALRSDVRISRVAEKTGKTTGVKTPDFSLDWRSWMVGLEARGAVNQ